MDEHLRFVARLLDGEKMARLCPGFRDLPQDRLDDLQPVQARRALTGSRASQGISTPVRGPMLWLLIPRTMRGGRIRVSRAPLVGHVVQA
jgi:hypothetical protein